MSDEIALEIRNLLLEVEKYSAKEEVPLNDAARIIFLKYASELDLQEPLKEYREEIERVYLRIDLEEDISNILSLVLDFIDSREAKLDKKLYHKAKLLAFPLRKRENIEDLYDDIEAFAVRYYTLSNLLSLST